MIIKKLGIRRQALGFSSLRQRMLFTGAPRGFTMIETFVAIVVLATSLAGALSLASQGFNSADVAGDQITASFLAQDAIEYIRFARDTTCLSSSSGCDSSWLSEHLAPCVNNGASPTYCYLDSSLGLTLSNPQTCVGSCPPLLFDSTTGLYKYTSGVTSKFTRYVSVSDVSGDGNEALIKVQVSWVTRGGYPRTPITLEEYIYNWQ